MYSYEETVTLSNKVIDDICDALETLHALTIGSDCLFTEGLIGDCLQVIDALEVADEKFGYVYDRLDEEGE